MTNMWAMSALVGLGGFAGSVARYGLSVTSQRWSVAWPLGTLAANVLGCLVIGIVTGLSARGETVSPAALLALATGFCGLQFNTPLVLLSGCVGFGDEYTRVEGYSNRDAGAASSLGARQERARQQSQNRLLGVALDADIPPVSHIGGRKSYALGIEKPKKYLPFTRCLSR